MSKLNIACLLSPMANTEGPMEIVDGKVLTGPKKIMGKYGEVGLEAAITFGEEHPDAVHIDILTVGKSNEVTTLQQSAIATIQPGKFPGTLGVHALETNDIDEKDGFEVAGILTAMIRGLETKPDLILAGRESWDYAHGVVGPAVAQQLEMPYFSGVSEIKLNEGMGSVTATFIEGNDKIVLDIPFPVMFGTTDWLNGKDSSRFTSLKGVMMAKKFKRTMVDMGSLDLAGVASRTAITAIESVKSERKNRKCEGDEGGGLAKQMIDILINQDKALVAGGGPSGEGAANNAPAGWAGGSGLDLSDDVVLVADHDGKSIRKSTLQALSQARKIADDSGKNVSVLVLGSNTSAFAHNAAGYGADRIVAVESAALEHPTLENYARCLQQLLGEDGPHCLMIVANDLGRDLAAFMASATGGGLLQDVVDLNLAEGGYSGSRIVSNARFLTHETITDGNARPVISIRATAFDPAPSERETAFVKIGLDVTTQASLKEVVAGEKTRGVPLNEAKIIVSGGRGMKAAENFPHLHELADLLGGAVGASRAVTDLEWVPHNLQIGQTGTTVAPDVYFAIGISGAIQHLTGMLGSKYIVAVNPDADAPIHKHADLSVIAKWEDVIPPFIEQVKKAVGK